MSSDGGTATRETTRTVIAVLAVLGFVFVAAVLPAVGNQAPGASLVPGQTGSGGAGGQAASGALQELLGGQRQSSTSSSGASQGGDSLVQGLFSQLPRGSGGLPRTSGQQGSGLGRSAFGALNPGSSTGVGSQGSPLSQSLRNQSAIPHLVVESPVPSYWRTGAYGAYTGSGWEGRGQVREAFFPMPVTGSEADRRRIRQEVRLLRPASSLPAAWEVVNIQGLDQYTIQTTRRGGLKTPRQVPANTTYTAISMAPPRDPSRLRSAGRNYPDVIEQRYTSLPDSTPDRVAEFTDQLTSDADNPFETATQIERWLESNKEYSLRASHSGGDVTAQFLFEMDRGYCEYFATSMAVMLRTQGIPARYAVGYSTGQPQGNGTYVVRAMNAHAWVEVYFPDTGWVRFDPTPGQSRLASESRLFQQAMNNASAEQVTNRFLDQADNGGPASLQRLPDDQGGQQPRTPSGSDQGGAGSGSGGNSGSQSGTDGNQTDDNRTDGNRTSDSNPYNHTERGSPGESFSPTSEASYAIELLGNPVPGQQLAVEVTRGGDPAVGVGVRFNGESVGTTNSSGIAVGEVPFASQLVVSISPPANDTDGGSNASSAGLFATNTRVLGSDGAGAVAPRPPPSLTRQDNGTAGGNTTRSFDVPTDINVSLSGPLDPGATATVRATIDGRPVTDATVSLNGQQVATTGDDGQADVQFPANESVSVAVRRGDAAGNRTVTLADVNVSVSGFALPGLSVTVRVTDEGDPVQGATVAVVDGSTSVTTGADGTASVSLPFATAVSVRAVTPGGISKTRPVELRLFSAGLGLLVALAGLGVLVRLRRQAARAGRSIGAQLVATLYWLSGAFVSVLVSFGAWGERILGTLPTLLGGLASRLRAALAAVADAIREGDASRIPNPLVVLRRLLAGLVAALRSLGTGGGPIPTPGSSDGGGDGTSMQEPAGGTMGGEANARERIRTAWHEFRDRLSVSNPENWTPGELAREGLRQGHPAEPVRTLTEAFRAVEYGERDPTKLVADAEAASEQLLAAAGNATQPPTESASATTDGGEDDPGRPSDETDTAHAADGEDTDPSGRGPESSADADTGSSDGDAPVPEGGDGS